MLGHQLITKDFHYFTCNIHIPEGVVLNKHIRLSPRIKLSDIRDVMIVIDGVCEMIYHPQEMVAGLGLNVSQDTLYHPFLATCSTDEVLTDINEIRIEFTHKPLIDLKSENKILPRVFLYASGQEQTNFDTPMDMEYISYPITFDGGCVKDYKLYTVPNSIHTYLKNKADGSIIIPRVKYVIGDCEQIYEESSTLDLTQLEDWSDLVGESGIFKLSISSDEYDPDVHIFRALVGQKARLIKENRCGLASIIRTRD